MFPGRIASSVTPTESKEDYLGLEKMDKLSLHKAWIEQKTALRGFYVKDIMIPVSISSITKEVFQNSSMKKGEKKQGFSIYSMQESRRLYLWNAEMLKELNKIPCLQAHNQS